MRRVINLLSAIVLMIAYACNSEQVSLSQDLPLTYHIWSRSENSSLSLPFGSQILLNAHGGIEIDNQIFTYNGSTWENGINYHWTNPEGTTDVIALYPTYPNNNYTLSHLYSNGELEDILMTRKTYSRKETIKLQFEHLFSLFTINIEETLLDNLQDIQLTVPAKVESIDPQKGTFSLTEEPHLITRSNTGINSYSFILPPMEACILTLTLFMKDNTIHQIDLNSHTFLSGQKYECNVVRIDSRPGIRTAEDLITFSQLINETYKGDKTLVDFGEQVDGKMVYTLFNDIELTEDDCNRLEPIGDHTDIPFQDIFDGNGHTISNLRFKTYNGYGGLFGKIDSNAIIKNLNIDNCLGAIKIGDNSSGIGIIVGRCYGTISNCHVTNSTLSNDKSSYTGGISGYTNGIIINCSVRNTTLEASLGSLGFITGYLYEGNIMNSYSCNNTVNLKTTHNGGICGYAQNGTITNCYVYANIDVKGHIVGTGSNATITYCYCDQVPLINNNTGGCTYGENHKYTTSFTATSNNTPIHQLLNQWIESSNTNKGTYIYWKEDPTLPAVFANP